MQSTDLIKYINNPQLIEVDAVNRLQKLVHDFPYFQSAHLLLSISSRKWNPSVYQHTLKKTAVILPNRTHLFNLIKQIENASIFQNETHVEEKNEFVKTKQELDILKVTEDIFENQQSNKLSDSNISNGILQKSESFIETEITNQVLNTFVEKEILKIAKLKEPELEIKEPENFSDWLSFLKNKNGKVDKLNEESKTKSLLNFDDNLIKKEALQIKKQKNGAIIDKIISTNPGFIKNKEEQKFYSAGNQAKESLLENEHLVTETLAKIYALQGNINKSVRAYEILSLKFPQKSAYFATLIENLKNNK